MRSKFDFLSPGKFSKKFTHLDLPMFLDKSTGDLQKYFGNICTTCSEMIDSVYPELFSFPSSSSSSSSLTTNQLYGQYVLFSAARLSRRQTNSSSIFKANILWFIRIVQIFGVLCELALYPDLVPREPGTVQRNTQKFAKALQVTMFSCLGYISSCLSGESRAYKPAIAAFINFVGPPELQWQMEMLVCLKVNVRAATFAKLGELILALLVEEGISFESPLLEEIASLVEKRKQLILEISEGK